MLEACRVVPNTIFWSVQSHNTGTIREGTFFIGGGGGGWRGFRRGGSLVIFLQIGKGQTCFIFYTWRVTGFLARKNYSMSLLFCIYKQSYQSRLI